MHDLETTIVAVATPPGRGGVGCIRISGPDAHRIGAALFQGSTGSPQGATGSTVPRFGRFVDREGRRLDHGFLWLLTASNSFTAEVAAELWPHGSAPVLAELVQGALEQGARAAEPGEFTYRALRNGRLDLTRAEAVRDLIDARTVYQARIAFKQAEGAVAEQVEPLRLALEEWIARAEAAVEFVEESDVHLTRERLAEAIDQSIQRCQELLDGFQLGRMVRSGATLAVVGRPNAGKSSLFNRLLAEDRAIVTEVPGTTRDTLEAELHLGGIPVRLIDTAGLRDSADPVEAEGIRRARRTLGEADLVLWVLDRSQAVDDEEQQALAEAIAGTSRLEVAVAAAGDPLPSDPRQLVEELASRVVVAANKSDLSADPKFPNRPDWVEVSAKSGEGLDRLRAALRRRLIGASATEDPVLTDARHADALRRTLQSLTVAKGAAREGMSEELVLEDLRVAMNELGSITGEFTTEDLYDKIFSTFCIGK